MKLVVGARESPLSKKQVEEVKKELLEHHPEVTFSPLWLNTLGDRDRTTSLKDLGRSDFFTRDVDLALLRGDCRIAIHSAKDLAAPLPLGLSLVALTKGVSNKDLLVTRDSSVMGTKKARIGTSSLRREALLKALLPDAICVDVRGTIEERLSRLQQDLDGVIIAEAALIRFGLSYPSIPLPGTPAAFQGQLAIVARSDDQAMHTLFSCLDHRKGVLYTGLKKGPHQKALHIPFIDICPRKPIASFKGLEKATHLLFTSQEAVRLFFQLKKPLPHQIGVSIGEATAQAMKSHGFLASFIAKQACQEGLIDLLQEMPLDHASFFWPRSSLARPHLQAFFKARSIPLYESILYDTVTRKLSSLPSLDAIDEIHFASPSAVDAYLSHFDALPDDKILTAIGPVTHKRLTTASTDKG